MYIRPEPCYWHLGEHACSATFEYLFPLPVLVPYPGEPSGSWYFFPWVPGSVFVRSSSRVSSWRFNKPSSSLLAFFFSFSFFSCFTHSSLDIQLKRFERLFPPGPQSLEHRHFTSNAQMSVNVSQNVSPTDSTSGSLSTDSSLNSIFSSSPLPSTSMDDQGPVLVTTTIFTGPAHTASISPVPMNSSSPPFAAIVGGIAGGIVLAVVAVIAWTWWGRCLKRKAMKERAEYVSFFFSFEFHLFRHHHCISRCRCCRCWFHLEKTS